MAKQYVRLLVDPPHKGRVFVVNRVNKRDWLDWIRGYPASVSIKDFPRKHDIGLFSIHDVEEISEKEYFTEKLRGR